MRHQRWYERAGVFGVAAILLIAGALKYTTDHSDEFLAVGFVVLGVWIAVEVGHIVQKRLTEIEHAEVVEGEEKS